MVKSQMKKRPRKSHDNDQKRGHVNGEVSILLRKRYEVHCVNNDLEPTFEGFFEFLIQLNFIPEDRPVWFFIIDKYPEYLYNRNANKTQAIEDMSQAVPLEVRQIWNLIGNKMNFFKRKTSIPFRNSYLKRK